ncbi:uncharacterized protein LOC143917250 [Arctopsyche grandis]|uniref:uncharacterized protein LOC143917250 n=1 Tax=Arctopsyche grandis TaxID=121162 RepID=UPI00406D6B8C
MILKFLVFGLFCSVLCIDPIPIPEPKDNKWDKNVRSTAQIGFHATLYHDMYLLKTAIKSLEDQMIRFSDFYANKLDQKLSSLLTSAMNLDANVKSIQEKAHSWDLLQHHVSAWNEQIKSLDRKVDIISGGQEKMLLLDGKLGFLLNLEYNSQRTVNKLTSLEDRLDSIEKAVKNKEARSPTIYDEFATRGVLSTFKTLEQKMDRSNLMLHQMISNRRGIAAGKCHSNESESHYVGKGKYIVTCSTPPIIEELVKDMSSKVDLVYDKIMDDSGSDEEEKEKTSDIDDNAENEYSDEIYQSDEAEFSTPNPGKSIILSKSERKVVKKFLKHLVCPSRKKLDLILNKINTSQASIDNLTQIYMQDKNNINNIECNKMVVSKNEEILKKSWNELIKNISKMCQCNLSDSKQTTESIYDNNSTILTNNYPTITVNKYNEKESIETIFNDAVRNGNSKNTQSIFSTTDMSSTMEYDDFSADDIYYINVSDLSLDIVRRLTVANYSVDFCRNPGSEYCDDEGFVTIQSRVDGGENFSRSWNEYKLGFGSLDEGNFWIGNEAIHYMTLKRNQYLFPILKIELEDFEGNTALAQYSTFEVDSEEYFYKLKIRGYTGNASDSFTYHNGAKFSTYDKTNDKAPACCPCSNSYGGGWWFDSCFESNLNGVYYDVPTKDDFRGIIWEHWAGETSLAKTKMSIKMRTMWMDRKPTSEDP